MLRRFRVSDSDFVDLTPNKPEKVGDAAATAAVVPSTSRLVPYTIHVRPSNIKADCSVEDIFNLLMRGMVAVACLITTKFHCVYIIGFPHHVL